MNENLITIMRDEWGHIAPGDKALDDFITQQRIAAEQLTAATLSGIESKSGGPSARAKKASATFTKTETSKKHTNVVDDDAVYMSDFGEHNKSAETRMTEKQLYASAPTFLRKFVTKVHLIQEVVLKYLLLAVDQYSIQTKDNRFDRVTRDWNEKRTQIEADQRKE